LDPVTVGSVTMTTEAGKKGESLGADWHTYYLTTLYRMNFSGYVGHMTIFSSMFTTARCLVVGLGLG